MHVRFNEIFLQFSFHYKMFCEKKKHELKLSMLFQKEFQHKPKLAKKFVTKHVLKIDSELRERSLGTT